MAAQNVNGSQVTSLKIFEGREGEDVELFIANVEQCMQAYGWTPAQTCEITKMRMQGVAAQWIRAEHLCGNDVQIWADAGDNVGLKSMLLTRFKVSDNVITAAAAVEHLRQEPNESVDTFYDRCIIAVDKLHFSLDEQAKQDQGYKDLARDSINALYNAGLKPSIRTRLLANGATPPADTAELRKRVRQIELQLKLEGKSGKIFAIEPDMEKSEEGGSGDTLEGRVEALTKKRDAFMMNKGRKTRDMKDVVCYSCNKKGHYSFNCFQAKRGRGGRGRGRGGFRRGRGGRRPVYEIEEEEDEDESWQFEEAGNAAEEM